MSEAVESAAPEAFLAEVERIRASGVLGRSQQLQRLFDFLVECRASGHVPKELEVAVDCFGRSADTELAQDATVRVTAHKLRRRLEDFYREAGQAARLTIPRGEYRLLLQETAPDAIPEAPPRPSWQRWLPASRREGVAVLVAVLAVVLLLAMREPRPAAQFADQRASAVWTPILADDLPVQLVLGDYYIFGELDERGYVRRLVREFDIDSREELEQGFIASPELAQRYADLNLGYLPTSSAQALREVLPVVMSAGKPVMLTLASELDPATLRNTHVIYLGYLSALGMLEEMVLANSRYSIGGSYDELIDAVTGEALVSEAGEVHPPGRRYRDYSYVASIRGPGGHAHLIIAGTRDVGLMQAAEVVADRQRLTELAGRVAGEGPFEALYEVQGINGVNVEASLLQANRAGQ